jgi:hypothetical protein
MALNDAYYNALGFLFGFVGGKILLHEEMPWAKFFR